jgi:hypothetical protein
MCLISLSNEEKPSQADHPFPNNPLPIESFLFTKNQWKPILIIPSCYIGLIKFNNNPLNCQLVEIKFFEKFFNIKTYTRGSSKNLR